MPSPHPPPTRTIEEFLDGLKGEIGRRADWQSCLEYILALGAGLPAMDAPERCEETRFHGCQSQIWLLLRCDPASGRILIKADSDARIMRGLLAIAVGLYHGRAATEVVAHPPEVLGSLNLTAYLAPSRANGFHRILQHIHRFAAEAASASGKRASVA